MSSDCLHRRDVGDQQSQIVEFQRIFFAGILPSLSSDLRHRNAIRHIVIADADIIRIK